MSRHVVYRGDNTLLAYGIDLPTGGFFWQITGNDDELLDDGDGLTLTELTSSLAKFSIDIPIKELIDEFMNAEKPTPLQINVGKMFNKDIISMLSNVGLDLMENYTYFLPDKNVCV